MYTVDQINDIINEARKAAEIAAAEYFEKKLDSVDQYACGFAWVNIYEYAGKKIKGNTKLGKAFKAVGLDQDYATKAFQIWNPSSFPCQNIDTKEAGAEAAAEVFRKYGFVAYAGSRMD